MIRVLVDLLYHSGSRGGTETYARELYRRLGLESDIELTAFASTEFATSRPEWFPGRIIDSGIKGANRAAWARGETVTVSRAAERLGSDVIHSPANLGPVRGRVPLVLTLHDLVAFLHPEWVPTRATGPILRAMIRGAARHARAIVTSSQAAADDIVAVLGIPSERISVIPLGGGIEPQPSSGAMREGRNVLSPGNRMPHKNQAILLEALARMDPDSRPVVEFTGSRDGDPLLPIAQSLGVEKHIRLHGWLSDEELEAAFARAGVIALPTQFEGFGLPVLEAMSRGRAVICSDIPVLREVAGDAAVYVAPDDAGGFAAEISRVLADPSERARLVRDGHTRAAMFSWDRTASEVAEVLRRAAVSAR